MPDFPLSAALRKYLEVQYDLRRVLGEGGMGVVLLASERVLDRMVAIKVLHRHAAENPELRERFRREARVAAKLSHPNIVPLHAFGDVDGELFFVMGFVEGETLASRLRQQGRLSHEESVRILREVSDALAFAHAKGVVHRDIKPENVLLEAGSGRALLADFGIAREGHTGAAQLTGTGIVIGTPHYMSPEQAVSDSVVDHRADIYAVGVMGYRMLAGKLPFDGANVREILTQQMVAQPKDLARVDPGISAAVAAAIMRCLEKEPSRRWDDLGAFRLAIADVTDDADENLHDELKSLSSGFLITGTMSGIALWFWVLNFYWWQNETLSGLLPMPIFAPPFAMAMITAVAARKFGFTRAFGMALRPPKWWAFWWPRAFRRPTDVWDRLPAAIRYARQATLISFGLGIPLVASQLILTITLPPEKLAKLLAILWLKTASFIGVFILLAGFYSAAIVLHVWARRNGALDKAKRSPWFGEPNASVKWKRPEFARFLKPIGSMQSAIPESADRLGAAISEQVRAMVRGGILAADSPASVAGEVVAAIEGIDRELEMLAKGGDEAELAKLDSRLESLGAGDAGIVEMLRRQREAVAAIVRRQSEQKARRERLVARMRELFLALDDVKRSATAASPGEITGRLDEVCSDLRRLASGYDELRSGQTTPMA